MKTSPFAAFAALLIATATTAHAEDNPPPPADPAKPPCCPASKGSKGIGPPPSAPVLVKGDFELTNVKTGKPANKASFDGSYRLVFFGFTRCRVVCPLGLSLMGSIMKQLDEHSEETPPLLPVFISIDPKRDSVEGMKEYLGNFDARIVGLRGTDEEVGKAMKSFRIEAPKMEIRSETDYQFDHPSLIMLMGPKGDYLKSIPSSGNAGDLANELLKAMIEDQATKP